MCDAHAGSRRAVRVDPDRILCDGIQTEPDALRAHLLARATPHGAAPERAWDGIRAVVRTHIGRQCEPACDAARGVPHSGYRTHDVAERVRGSRRVPARYRATRSSGAAVHGDGEHHHGAREEGRRSPRGPREDQGTISTFLSLLELTCERARKSHLGTVA
jgi:hypothetical protein